MKIPHTQNLPLANKCAPCFYPPPLKKIKTAPLDGWMSCALDDELHPPTDQTIYDGIPLKIRNLGNML